MKSGSSEQRAWFRLAGLGAELAGAVAGFCLLGYWIDRWYDTAPWGLLIGAICGLVGGFSNFIRSSLKALSAQRARSGPGTPPGSQLPPESQSPPDATGSGTSDDSSQ